MSQPLIVAVDGPSGVGKSTVSRQLAKRLGVPVLDTGAMYRAIGLAVLRAGADPDDRAAVAEIAARAPVDVVTANGGLAVRLAGEILGEQIRTPEVSDATSRIAVHPEVRRRMVELQRQAGRLCGAVVEGRDIGTVVFPDTPHKFFLEACPSVRASRRRCDLEAAGRKVSLEEVERDLERRDARDSSRDDSPLRHDESYVVIDTSKLDPPEVVERMIAAIVARREVSGPGPVAG